MAPTTFREGGFRFFSCEAPKRHVHISHPDGEAKFWLKPDLQLATSVGLSVSGDEPLSPNEFLQLDHQITAVNRR